MNMRFPWYTHVMLQRFLRFDIKIVNEGPLRIGSGKTVPLRAIDLPVTTIKLPQGDVAYIPGSSLKGVIRSTCEFIAKSSGIEEVCMAGACSTKHLEGDRERTYHKALDAALKNNDIEGVIRILDRYCIVCKTFGSSSFGSHVEFQDAYPKGKVALGIKSGIAINRRSGAVKKRALYEIEYVEPGNEFFGSITIRNLPNYLVGLISLALDYLNSGLMKLGGFKSRGFGKVMINVTKLDGYIFDDLGAYKLLKDVKSLKPLDELDGEVEVDLSDIQGTLERFKRRWIEYVQASKRRRAG
ncbi:MAG: CRISPR-associated RAMP protein Csx7 [Aigarchaeota archaeon]|nr:CRISPR-associated RAMP protein Csx7 [Aigarchaeota archaeon]